MEEYNKSIVVAGFDPPASSNMGWAILSTNHEEGCGELLAAGVLHLPDDEAERLLRIRDFLVDLVEQHNINVMCFERAIGNGMASIREQIGENTGVIKLVGASYGIDFVAIHTSTMALQFTGYGGGKDKNGVSKKTRTKQTARDIFYPGESYKKIASSESGSECFEHLADALGFCTTYLLQLGIPIKGPGGRIDPKPSK